MNDWYEIRVKGHLDCDWAEWFEGLTLSYTEQGETVLSGRIVDQPALLGILSRLLNLGVTIVSLNQGRNSPN